MTLQQLKYLVEIAKCGSITEAAQKLFIAQPSLSKTIKDLEEEFRITILKRSRQGVTFTTEGIQFLRFAQRILDVSHDMEDYFGGEEGSARTIHLSLSSQHYMFVVDALIAFVQSIAQETNYTLRISEVRTSQVIEDVLKQKSQIGILYISELIQKYMQRLFEKNHLEFIPFYDFPPFVYLQAQHPLAGRKTLSLEELAGYPYVRYDQGADPYQFSEEIVLPYIQAKRTIYVTDRSTMLSIIGSTDAYNLGTGCLLPSVVGENITSIPLRGNAGTMKIGWIKRRDMPMSKEMQKFVEHMQNSLEKVAAIHC